MKREVMEKWVEALRSGDYRQGRGALKCNDSFCCLGVLCDISGEDVGSWCRTDEHDGYPECFTAHSLVDRSHMVLPYSVREWAGMQNSAGEISRKRIALTNLNDSGMTFDQIADVIEENWELL